MGKGTVYQFKSLVRHMAHLFPLSHTHNCTNEQYCFLDIDIGRNSSQNQLVTVELSKVVPITLKCWFCTGCYRMHDFILLDLILS